MHVVAAKQDVQWTADSQEIYWTTLLQHFYKQKSLERVSKQRQRRDILERQELHGENQGGSSSRRRTSSSSFHSRDIEWSYVKTTKSHKSKPWISTSDRGEQTLDYCTFYLRSFWEMYLFELLGIPLKDTSYFLSDVSFFIYLVPLSHKVRKTRG